MNFFQIFFFKNTVLIVEYNLHSDGLKFEQVLALSVEAENMTSFKLFLLKGWWCWGMTLMLTITSKKVPFHLCLPKSRILSLPISRVNSCWLFLYLIWNMSCSLHSHVFSFWIKCPLLTWWVGAAWSRIFEHGIQGFEPQLHSLYAVWLGATFLPSLVLTFLIGKMWRIQWFSHRVVLWIKWVNSYRACRIVRAWLMLPPQLHCMSRGFMDDEGSKESEQWRGRSSYLQGAQDLCRTLSLPFL